MAVSPEQLAAQTRAVIRRAPSLKSEPGLLLGAAASSIPIRTADQIAGFREAVFTKRQLEKMDRSHALAAWADLDEGMRERLGLLQYRPPAPVEHLGFFEANIGRPLGFVVGGTLGNLVEHANKLSRKVVGNVAHIYRASVLLSMDKDAASEYGLERSVTSWEEAKRRTEKDEVFYPEIALREYGVALPEAFLEVAVDAAKGFTADELVAVYGQRGLDALTHESFGRAAAVLEGAKLSFGRNLARGFHLNPGTKPFRFSSGTLDALDDWFADPFNIVPIGKVRRGLVEGRYFVETANDVRSLAESSKKVLRAHETIARAFAEKPDEAPAFLRNTFGRKIIPFLEDLSRERPASVDEVTEFFAGRAAVSANLQGKAGGLADGIFGEGSYRESLRLSASRQAWARTSDKPAVKDLVSVLHGGVRIFDAAGNVVGHTKGMPVARNLARLVRRLSARTPQQRSFDPSKKEAVEFVREIAQYTLPRNLVDEYVNVWSNSNLAQRRQMWDSLYGEMADVLGIYTNPALSRLRPVWDEMLAASKEADAGLQRHLYGSGYDGRTLGVVTLPDGTTRSYGLLDTQLEGRWYLLNFNEIAEATRSIARLQERIGRGHIPHGLIDKFMDRVWRPGKVLTLSQGFRQGGEELAGYMLEQGFLPVWRARLALSAEKHLKSAAPADGMVLRGLVHQVKRALGKGQRLVSDEQLVESAERLYKLMDSYVLAGLLPHNRDVMDHTETLSKFLKANGTPVFFRVKAGGLYQAYEAGDELMAAAWQSRLRELLDSQLGRIVLEHDSSEAAEAAVRSFLISDEAASLRSSSAFFDTVARDIGEDAALDRWASEVVESVRSLYHSSTQQPLSFVARLRAGELPSIEDLDEIAIGDRPLMVTARELAVVHNRGERLVEAITHHGFALIDKQMSWLAREPMLLAEFDRHRRLLEPLGERLRAAGVAEEGISFRLEKLALQRAGDEVIEHIDNPHVKSQFARAHRSLFPFWYASDQFVRRWGKRMLRDPGVGERAYLTMLGIEHSGFVERDYQGELVFHVPASGFLFRPLLKALGTITGNNVYSAVPVDFTGKVKYALPGADEPLRPAVGPLLSIPTKFLHARFPEFSADSEAIIGRPRSSTLWEQLAPTAAVRLVKPLVAQDDDAQILSPVNNAIAYLESLELEHTRRGGSPGRYGLPEDASVVEREEYVERIRGWARTMLLLRGIFGLASPGGGNPEIIGDMKPEFRRLLSSLPLEQAVEAMVRLEPDADPFTVFQSEAAAGSRGPLPATESAGRWAKANEALIREYGATATWLLPSAPETWDASTYREQLAVGLRRRLSSPEFWREQKLAAYRREYFQMRDSYLMEAVGVSGLAREQLDNEWQAFSDQYLAAHPLLEEDFALADQRRLERTSTIYRLGALLEDSRVTENEDTRALRVLVDAYREYESVIVSLRERRSRTAQNQRLQATMRLFEIGQSVSSETARSFFESVIRPDLKEYV